jgi:hypothetical protein
MSPAANTDNGYKLVTVFVNHSCLRPMYYVIVLRFCPVPPLRNEDVRHVYVTAQFCGFAGSASLHGIKPA